MTPLEFVTAHDLINTINTYIVRHDARIDHLDVDTYMDDPSIIIIQAMASDGSGAMYASFPSQSVRGALRSLLHELNLHHPEVCDS